MLLLWKLCFIMVAATQYKTTQKKAKRTNTMQKKTVRRKENREIHNRQNRKTEQTNMQTNYKLNFSFFFACSFSLPNMPCRIFITELFDMCSLCKMPTLRVVLMSIERWRLETKTEICSQTWWLGQCVGCSQRSHCRLASVSTWMGDCLHTGKPSRYITKHPGQHSLPSSTGLAIRLFWVAGGSLCDPVWQMTLVALRWVYVKSYTHLNFFNSWVVCIEFQRKYFQARPHDVPLFAWTGTMVPRRSRHSSIDVASRHRLRSANRHRLIVPRCRLNTYGRRAFPVAGPMVWNSLPDELRDPACDVDSFKQFFKTILFSFC